jgi:hypothetical protein
MSRPATPIILTEDERRQLEATIARPKARARYVERACIVL